MKQVANLFIVDFKVGNTDEILSLSVRLDLLEDIIEGSWHDTLVDRVIRHTSDSERLSSTSLSIRKDCSVIALNDIFAHRVCCLCENFLLLRTINKEQEALIRSDTFKDHFSITYFQS